MAERAKEGGGDRFGLVGSLVGVAVLAALAFGVYQTVSGPRAPTARKVMQFTRVQVTPPPQAAKPPPPPQPVTPPSQVEPPHPERVELKRVDLPQEAPRPEAPAGGKLALAAEGEGPGDAFNLAGSPGGRGLLSGGGLGDGTGTGLGGGDDNARRFGWYYARIASDIEEALRKQKKLLTAALRVELRVWADRTGRIERIQVVKGTGRPDLEEALQAVVGLRLKEPPPEDLPMPMIARFTARRPQ